MDSTQYITTMPTMDIFAYEKVPGTEKSMLRRQQAIPERRFSISFEDSDSDFDANMDLDPEDDYFSQTYAPLSCLPTPPMRCAATSPFTQALESAFVQDKDTNLLGPAIHMSNLIPTSASLITPSPTLVQDILYRANLPSPILELAVVILDSLTPKFATQYRRQLPLPTSHPTKGGPDHDHIDEVRPELIAMTSLLVANKFLDDDEVRTTTKNWARNVGCNMWTCQQINTTERLILDCLGWNIMELAGQWLMSEAREDMQRAGRNARKRANKSRRNRPPLERTELGIDDMKTGLQTGFEMEEREVQVQYAEEMEEIDGIQAKDSGSSDRSVQFMGQWTPVESPIAPGRKVLD